MKVEEDFGKGSLAKGGNVADLISVPREATFYVEQKFEKHPTDLCRVIAISVHFVNEKFVVCNSWVLKFGKWEKLLSEQVTRRELSPWRLVGEAGRLLLLHANMSKQDRLEYASAIMGIISKAFRACSNLEGIKN
ncbi:MAG: hypothetical protein ABIB98_00100 [bacterium]